MRGDAQRSRVRRACRHRVPPTCRDPGSRIEVRRRAERARSRVSAGSAPRHARVARVLEGSRTSSRLSRPAGDRLSSPARSPVLGGRALGAPRAVTGPRCRGRTPHREGRVLGSAGECGDRRRSARRGGGKARSRRGARRAGAGRASRRWSLPCALAGSLRRTPRRAAVCANLEALPRHCCRRGAHALGGPR